MARGEKKGFRTRRLSRSQKKQAAKSEAKKAIQKRAKLPNSFRLTWQSFKTLWTYWKPLGGIILVYAILSLIFASGISGLNTTVTEIKASLEEGNKFGNALDGFSSLIGSAGASGSQAAPFMQSILVILTSLAVIWALRQLLAGNSIRVKQAYYQSMSPLIPFLLVLIVVIIQLLPVTLVASIIGNVLATIFDPSGGVTAIFLIIFAGLAAWSFYMISSSIFALYIVTLPDMQPRQALRSAKNLVRFRRWQLMRRLIFLPIFIFIVMALITVPLIMVASFLVAAVFYLLGVLAILFVHTYLYTLYRSLLDEAK